MRHSLARVPKVLSYMEFIDSLADTFEGINERVEFFFVSHFFLVRTKLLTGKLSKHRLSDVPE